MMRYADYHMLFISAFIYIPFCILVLFWGVSIGESHCKQAFLNQKLYIQTNVVSSTTFSGTTITRTNLEVKVRD